MVKFVFGQVKMMAYFMEHRFADFIDELFPGSADAFVLFLKDVDDVGESAGVFDASPGTVDSAVEAHETLVFAQAQLLKQAPGGARVDFDGDFFQEACKGFGEVGDGLGDEVLEFVFADRVGHRLQSSVVF
jgi:hypothetical protein